MVKKPAKASRFLLERNLPSPASPAQKEPGFARLPTPWHLLPTQMAYAPPHQFRGDPWLKTWPRSWQRHPVSRCVLTRVADFEAFSVVGMIGGPAEIDFVPAAGDGQRGRVVPTQRQEQRTLARGTCKEGGNEDKSGLTCKQSLVSLTRPSAFLPKEWARCGTVARELSLRVQERRLTLRHFFVNTSPSADTRLLGNQQQIKPSSSQ